MSNLQERWRKHIQESKGLGDTVAKITSKVGIRPCGGCKKRQKWLNKQFPYQNSLDKSDNSE